MRPHPLPPSLSTRLGDHPGLPRLALLAGLAWLGAIAPVAGAQERTPDTALPVDQGATPGPGAPRSPRRPRPTRPTTATPAAPAERVVIIDAAYRGIDPIVARAVTETMRRTATATGFVVVPTEAAVAAARALQVPYPPTPLDLWRVTFGAQAQRGAFANVWAEQGNYVVEITVVTARGPATLRGGGGQRELRAVVDQLMREVMPRAAPATPAVPSPGAPGPGQVAPPTPGGGPGQPIAPTPPLVAPGPGQPRTPAVTATGPTTGPAAATVTPPPAATGVRPPALAPTAQPTPGGAQTPRPVVTPPVPGTSPAAPPTATGPAAAVPPPATPPPPAAAIVHRPRREAPFGFTPGPPAPILVVPLADARVSATTAQAVVDAVAAALAPMSRGRPVQPVSDPARLASIGACREPTCLGRQVAEAGGVAGVIVRIARRGARAPIDVTIGVVDPVSGAPRREPVTGQIPAAAEAAPGEHVTPLVAQLVDAMPSPPLAQATLLVTVNVDDAVVRIDSFDAGRSPLAPLTIRPGRYPVLVTADGYHLTRQMVTVADGEQARLDVTLEQDQAARALIEDQQDRSTDQPIYTRWWFLAAGGAVVVAATIAIIVVATSGGGPNNPPGFPVPPIQ